MMVLKYILIKTTLAEVQKLLPNNMTIVATGKSRV